MRKILLASAALVFAGCTTSPPVSEEVSAEAPALAPAAPAAEAAVVEPVTSPAPQFTSVQSDLFGIVGSLSNAWADIDNDGDLDYAVSLKGGAIQLYLQEDDGTFTDVTAAFGLPAFDPSAPPPSAADFRNPEYKEFRGVSFGDFDGDGYIDLFAGATMPNMASRLYRNVGGTGFVDVAEEAGLTVPGRSSRQNNWIDVDNDGDLDLYAADRIADNKLFGNEGGVFTQMFPDAGPTDARATVGACWFDYNKDGKLDLFLANQSGATDALWRNEGDKFTDVAPDLGIDSPGRERMEGGVGCAIGDYDNDGNLDIFMAAYGPNRLYKNNGDGTFSDVSEAAGITEPDHVVGADWGDFDNDGDLDLFVVGYEGPSGEQTPVNMLYVNDGSGVFENILTLESTMNAADHGVVWVDYDLDGDLDLSVTDGYGPEGGHFVFRNDMPEAQRAQSLSVMVLDAKGYFTKPGTEVRAYDAAGTLLATRIMTTGGGYNAQSAIPVHFGLPGLTTVDVEVTYFTPAGRETLTLPGVSLSELAGQSLTVKLPE
ncbi:CRTAC1 family protein [uncultured Hyphomonas sp.]|uniref:CRTAC1 family protein n=1 Tax=uncultured Hyphomonas sp. TaxID=225298 RepID=UPI002AAB70F1|nr:CRTAC1 family protein [uncultured Hyphomonas sp.]